MIRIGDWVTIKQPQNYRPVDGYGMVVAIEPRHNLPNECRYVVGRDSSGLHWYYSEDELEVIDPIKTLGEEYFA